MLVVLIIFAAAILILGIIEPKEIVITRSILIKAPKEAIFEQIVNFKKWNNWSPWYKMDSTMKITYAGTDGQPNSSFHWVGAEKKTGEGEIINAGVNGTHMDYQLNIIKPFEKQSHGIFQVQDTNGMSKVTWNLTMNYTFPFNASLAFMNMDKMLGGDFESGLSNMKAYLESHVTAPTVDVIEVDYGAHVFEGFRKTVGFSDMSKFFMESYGELGKGMGAKINGAGVGLFYTWDTVSKSSDMVAAFPVSDTTMAVKGAVFTHIGPAKAFMAVHKGPYASSMDAHTALQKTVTAKGKTRALVIEEYLVGPHEQADSTKWVTNIYYLIK